ncbi:hypothetical protein CRENPOLYSF1_1710002 [Crenothrix polyspora]|uniref:Uncharacterized protein n=1 Tax=Crenothrix polyspora TaxID=360316 RepID=A0A1R4H4C1_9GAMM|nr:hypothetical protein CRENPOLYSF1_1710002 [Crenothrix polyspora]
MLNPLISPYPKRYFCNFMFFIKTLKNVKLHVKLLFYIIGE